MTEGTNLTLTTGVWGEDLKRRLEKARSVREHVAEKEAAIIQEVGAGAAIPEELWMAYDIATECLENPGEDDWRKELRMAEELVNEV